MFVVIVGDTGGAGRTLELMASKLRCGDASARRWHDPDRCGGAAAMVSGILPEDVFDRQPLVTDDLVFVCRARLDNRAELATKLGIPTAEMRELADSVLLQRAYGRWGDSTVQQLSGDFAFVAWHRRANRVVAAVDHLGAERLFWARGKSGLILCGQMEALLAHPNVSRTPDLPALAKLFQGGVDRSTTPFESVRALPGGHLLVWRAGHLSLTRWWEPSSLPTLRYRDPRDYVEHAREAFDRAVADRLRAVGDISATLSGGLDSGLATATAARQLRESGRGVTAYTSVPTAGLPCMVRSGWESDDGPYAQAVAAMHENVRHVLVDTGARCALDLLPGIHARDQGPTKSVSNLLWLDAISASIRSRGSRVLLTGQAGNATISWSGHGALAELTADGAWGPAFKHLYTTAAADPRRALVRLLRGPRSPASRPLRAYVPSGLAFLNASQLSITPESGMFVEGLPPRAFWAAFATTAQHTWWPDPLSQYGVEWRDPTADRRLVECLLTFPLHAFQTGGRPRGLARAIARGRLPDRVRLRSTRGAQVPELSGRIALNARRYRDALAVIAGSSYCRTLFDLEAIRRALGRHPDTTPAGHDSALAIDRACDVGLFLCRTEGMC